MGFKTMLRAPDCIDDVQGLHHGLHGQGGVCRNIRGQPLRNEVLAGIGSAPCSHLARSIARRSSLLLLLCFFDFLCLLLAGTVAAVLIAAAGAAAITLLFLGLLGLLGFLFLGDLLGTLRDPQVLCLRCSFCSCCCSFSASTRRRTTPLPTIASIDYVSINNNRSSA